MNSNILSGFTNPLLALVSLMVVPQAWCRADCEALENLSLNDVVGIASEVVPSGSLTLPGPIVSHSKSESVPTFCRVTLSVRPQITIEVWLPKDGWNERFRAEGGGGYNGFIAYPGMTNALRAGYATASTDTGHNYPSGFAAGQGAFALNLDGSLNRQLIEDFAWRSLRELTLKAKELIKAYYGRPPRYSYWRGYSAGGWQGLTVVQRLPEEYDGVLAGYPAINWDRFIPATLWPSVVMNQELGRAIDAPKLEAVRKAAIVACDGEDGVVDDLINDPRRCRYDPALLICEGEGDSDTCLTPREAQAVRKIWDGPVTAANGDRIWFGLERGAPFTTIAASEPNGIVADYLRFWIKQDPYFDWRTLKEADFEALIRESSAKFREMISSDQADLQRFRARGGKLLLLHGENDEIIFPRGTVHYFERVLASNGGKEEVDLFARLFLMPGVRHGDNGDAPYPHGTPSSSDPLFAAVVDWVEKGIAPDRIVASQKLPDGLIRTRPLCAYPTTARWTGRGSADRAQNFTCVDGAHNPDDFRVKALVESDAERKQNKPES